MAADVATLEIIVLYLCLAVHIAILLAIGAIGLIYRTWPPLQTRMLSLVHVSALGGLMWWFSWVMALGYLDHLPGATSRNCALIDFPLAFLGVAMFLIPITVRFHRMHQILVKFNARMHPPLQQSVLLAPPFFLGMLTLIGVPGTWTHSRTSGCIVHGTVGYSVRVGIATYMLVLSGCNAWFWYHLRGVRSQFNEYASTRWLIAISVVTGLAFWPLDALRTNSVELGRIADLVYPTVMPCTVFASLIGPALYQYLRRDPVYLQQFECYFHQQETARPADIQGGIEDHVQHERMRVAFAEFSGTVLASENIHFYQAVKEREQIFDYFERQAKTMEILNRFIYPDAPEEINIDGEKRLEIMLEDINSWSIFDDAMRQVIMMMETDLKPKYHDSAVYKRLVEECSVLDRERTAIRTAGIQPKHLRLSIGSFRQASAREILTSPPSRPTSAAAMRSPDSAAMSVSLHQKPVLSPPSSSPGHRGSKLGSHRTWITQNFPPSPITSEEGAPSVPEAVSPTDLLSMRPESCKHSEQNPAVMASSRNTDEDSHYTMWARQFSQTTLDRVGGVEVCSTRPALAPRRESTESPRSASPSALPASSAASSSRGDGSSTSSSYIAPVFRTQAGSKLRRSKRQQQRRWPRRGSARPSSKSDGRSNGTASSTPSTDIPGVPSAALF